MKVNEKVVNLIFFISFIVITLFISFYHENWRDEVQAYLLCRDMSFFELLKNVHYEGHPIFYYLILFPFVKMGFSLKIVNFFSLIFVYISVFLLLFRTDLKLIVKLSFLFSFPFIYLYSVIGRSYSFIILLIVLISIFYKKRYETPIILSFLVGVAINTHLVLCGFCFAIFLEFFVYEFFKGKNNVNKSFRKKLLLGIFIIIIFGVFLLLQFVPMFFKNDGMSLKNSFNLLQNILIFFGIFTSYSKGIFSLICLIVAIVFLIELFIYDKKYFFIYIFSLFFMISLFNFILGLIPFHAIFVSYVMFLFVFINIKSNFNLNMLIIIISILSLYQSCYFISSDIKYDFSSGKVVGKFINQNFNKDSVFFVTNDAQVSSIIPFTDQYRYYNLLSRQYFTYIVWNQDRENTIISELEIVESISKQKGKNKYYIYLDFEKLYCDKDDFVLQVLNDNYNIRRVYKSNNQVITYDEKYIIYEIFEK